MTIVKTADQLTEMPKMDSRRRVIEDPFVWSLKATSNVRPLGSSLIVRPWNSHVGSRR